MVKKGACWKPKCPRFRANTFFGLKGNDLRTLRLASPLYINAFRLGATQDSGRVEVAGRAPDFGLLRDDPDECVPDSYLSFSEFKNLASQGEQCWRN
jgi:hypothetical protein